MKKLLLFAGTTEGRQLVQRLAAADVELLACVATEYGKSLLPSVENLRVLVGRLDRQAIGALLEAEGIDCAVDATHPYAAAATENLAAACRDKNVPCLRLLREASDTAGCIHVSSMEEAAALLAGETGNALLTMGSGGLDVFSKVPDYRERFYVRVLPAVESLERCKALGFPADHVIAMQGPFSAPFNTALLRETHAVWLVTKDSGGAGGFAEKRDGAAAAGAQVIVVGRPADQGDSLETVVTQLRERHGVTIP